MSAASDRSTSIMNSGSPHHDEHSVDPAMDSLLAAYAQRMAHRPGLVERIQAATPAPVPAPIRPYWGHARRAQLALAASIVGAVVVGMVFVRPASVTPIAAVGAYPPAEAEALLVTLLAGSDEAVLDDHPFGSELRTMDSDWSVLAGEVSDVIAFAGGSR
jgi:hypothetical protein